MKKLLIIVFLLLSIAVKSQIVWYQAVKLSVTNVSTGQVVKRDIPPTSVYYDTSNSRIVVFSSEKQIFDFVGKESFKEEEGYGIVYGYTTDTNYVTNYLVLKTSGINYSTTLTITYNDVQIKYWMILTEK